MKMERGASYLVPIRKATEGRPFEGAKAIDYLASRSTEAYLLPAHALSITEPISAIRSWPCSETLAPLHGHPSSVRLVWNSAWKPGSLRSVS